MKMNRSLVRICGLAAVSSLGLVAGPALAATDTEPLVISASVVDSCVMTTAPIVFGAYAPAFANLSAPLDATGSVSVTCTSGATTMITLDQGAHDGGGSPAIPQRRMLSGTVDFLSYGLFSGSVTGSIWANTVATGVGGTGNGAQQTLTVYGRIPAGQNVPAGSYQDTVTATVTY
jgi:spore coat protein U-like protein